MEYGQLSDNLGQAQTTRINELISIGNLFEGTI